MIRTPGRPTILKDRPLTQKEKTKRAYEKLAKTGLTSRRVFISDTTVKKSISKFGGNMREALEAAIQAALNAPTDDNGQMSLVSDSQKIGELEATILRLTESEKRRDRVINKFRNDAKSTRNWTEANKMLKEFI